MIAQLWRGIRVFLGVGFITLALLVLVLEGAYFAYHVAKERFWGSRAVFERVDHPYWHDAWYAGWQHRLGQMTQNSVYDPYRGWHLPRVSESGLHVDGKGIRLTVHPMETDSAATRQVLMLGGSTMWGYSARDEYTIPSLVAQRLAQHGVTDVKVINLASIGFNTTQGAITLLLELRRGNTPAAVVSLDGVNEVGIIYQGESPGEVYAQRLAERQFDHSSFWREAARLRQHLHGTALAEGMLLRSLGLAKRPTMEPGPLCAQIAPYYAELVRSVDALAREHGFPIFYLSTPTLARSHKRRTVWEAWLAGTSRDFQELTVRCGEAVDSLLAPRRGKVYFPMDSLYDGDTTSVFIDHYGHVTERANGVIADRIVALLLPALQPAGRK